MKNKIFGFSLVLLFAFVGCGGGGSDNNSSIENQRVTSGMNISTEVKDDVLIVTEEGDLKGLAVKGVDASTNIENIQFQKVSTKPLPEIPNFITKITDFFVIENGIEEEVFVRVPLSKMPKDVDLNHLYLYTLVTTTHQLTPFWNPTLLERSLFNKSGEEYIEFKLVGLRNNTYFIGTEYSTEEEKSSIEKTKKEKDIISFQSPNLSGITCTPKEFVQLKDYNNQVCVFLNKHNEKTTITVLGFGKTFGIYPDTKWNGVTIEKMISWIREAQNKLVDMELEYDKEITMHVKKLDDGGVAVAYYTFNKINISDNNYSENEMKKTIKHEYFHHVQYVNTSNKISSFYCEHTKDKECIYTLGGVHRYTAWLMEGSADWFARESRKSPEPIILEKSLVNDAEQFYMDTYSNKSVNEAENPYRRAFFFHMISSHCNSNKHFFKKLFKDINDSNYKKIPNGYIIENDKSAIKSLQTALNTSECHFDFLGIEDNGLANVLLYYQYATAWQNDITLLDKNLKKGSITFQKSDIYTNTLNEKFTVPPYGVQSYIFKLSKFRQMTITKKNINGLKYYLLKKNKSGSIVDEANKVVKVPLDTDTEYFVVFVNDSEKDISGSIEITSTSQNTTPIKGSISLPNTAGDLNFVFLSKDTQTAFVLTKNQIEGNLYLYSYDISNPNAIQLLDTQFIEGNNYRYVYSGIYLSKDKTKLYTLIIDNRYGENIFSIIDISTPSSLNILGRYKSYIDNGYFSYNLMSEIKGFSEDESKVYFLSYIKKYTSSKPKEEVKLLDISDTFNMNLSDDDGLNYTLAGHEPQSSSNGVSVSIQDKKLIVERN